jgi:hypothetical protein
MCVKTLTVSQSHDNWTELLESSCSDLLRGDVLLERKSVDTAELTSIAVSGQCVVGTRSVVTAAKIAIINNGSRQEVMKHPPLRRICAHEYASCVFNSSNMISSVLQMQDEMFRSVVVGKIEGLLDGRRLDHDTLWDRLAKDINSGESTSLYIDLFFDRCDVVVG